VTEESGEVVRIDRIRSRCPRDDAIPGRPALTCTRAACASGACAAARPLHTKRCLILGRLRTTEANSALVAAPNSSSRARS
jgi:hypothetical protein